MVLPTEFFSTNNFCTQMAKLGNVVYYNFLPKNIVISHKFVSEIYSLPSNIISTLKGQIETDKASVLDNTQYIKQRSSIKILGYLFSETYLDLLIYSDAICLEQYIHEYINTFGSISNNGLIQIEDTIDFLIDILFKNACFRVFGKKLMALPDILGFANNILPSRFLSKDPTCAVKIIKDYYGLVFNDDSDQISECLVRVIRSMFVISPHRIHNILVNISSQPLVAAILINEQQKIIKVFGNSISMDAIAQMHYLDDFIQESMFRSAPASYLHRKIENTVILSNGIKIPKGSLLSINHFSKFNYNEETDYNLQKFIPQLNSKNITESENSCFDNMIYGYGNGKCPYSKYANAQMMTIISIIIRNYIITDNDEGNKPEHPGYKRIFTISPKTSSLYFKRIFINTFI
ncbi:hypothetical protein BB561_003055 [Smittium simulii]|uniref:Cytochrome P450 n=1 Tax=Smittium simulii TaxID=133385 RepID=A0A2T9YN24_9FUNG|nr:hypothetical protein BB561_003055 [Smittium simulii]